MIPVKDVAKAKGCTKATVINAIHKGLIDAERLGYMWCVRRNKKHDTWHPSVAKQRGGRTRAAYAARRAILDA